MGKSERVLRKCYKSVRMDDIPTQKSNPRNILQPTRKKLKHVGAKKKVKANIPAPKRIKSRQNEFAKDVNNSNSSYDDTPMHNSVHIIDEMHHAVNLISDVPDSQVIQSEFMN